MKLRLQEIADMVKGEIVQGDGAVLIEGGAGLIEATQKHISFLSNMRYFGHVYKTKAAAVLMGSDVKLDRRVSTAIVRVPRPDIAFAQILKIVYREKHPQKSGIDAKACIGTTVVIGENVYIGPYAVVEEYARIGRGSWIGAGSYIGRNCSIGNESQIDQRVSILDDTVIGSRVVIKCGSVIGSDGYGFYTVEGKHTKIPQVGRVVIEDDVEIQSLVTVDRGTTGATIIGAGTKIDNMVHIAHNVKIGKNCLIVAQVGISGSAKIGNNVTLAGQSGVAGHIEIGDNTICAGRAGIIGNISPGSFVAGYPSQPFREWKKIQVYLSKLPEMYAEFKKRKKSKK